MSEVTVKDLDALIAMLKAKMDEAEVQSEITKSLNKEIMRLEGQIVGHLKDLGRESYDSEFGKCKIVQKWRVNMPKDDEAKTLLFAHLREREIFDHCATVNSNSLNALFMRDWEAAKERGEGVTFSMPGIDAPKLFEAFDLKPKK